MPKQLILAIDAGTTGIRTVLYNRESEQVAYAYREFTQIIPAPGLLEHDPLEIYETIIQLKKEVMKQAEITASEIAAIGLATQRGTVVAWNKKTGKPIHHAIVWQDLRTAERCEELTKMIGLTISPNSAYTKYEWLLNNVPNCSERVETGDVLIGTLDSWLVWKLTGGEAFVTDVSNAVITNMWNPISGEWTPELAALIGMPANKLATIVPSSTVYGTTSVPEINVSIPIAAISGDQQAAMFGHLCLEPGDGKATYGTSVMVNINTGNDWIFAKNGCHSLALWRLDNEDAFCLEGQVITGGSAIDWATQLGLLDSPGELASLAQSVRDSGDVTFIPALQGLGTPYSEPLATGAFFGLTRATTKAHIARAMLEGIAFRTRQAIEALRENSPVPAFSTLRVDGGMANNDFFMQIQADVLSIPVERPEPSIQVTALGTAYMAGLAVGYWTTLDEIKATKQVSTIFTPSENKEQIQKQYEEWGTLANIVANIRKEKTPSS